MYYGYILFKAEIIFPQSIHYQYIFPPLCKIFYASCVKLHTEIGALHACCISVHHYAQNSFLEVHPAGGQKDGSQRVLNWYCREDEDEQIQGADFCG